MNTVPNLVVHISHLYQCYLMSSCFLIFYNCFYGVNLDAYLLLHSADLHDSVSNSLRNFLAFQQFVDYTVVLVTEFSDSCLVDVLLHF